MINANAHNNANPVTPQNSTSSQEGDKLPAEIGAAESKVREEERWATWAGRAGNWALLLYVLVTGALGWTTVWSNRANSRLRAAENLLNNLQKEKIRGDASKDVENARNESKERIVIETARVEGEANRKIEAARGEAGAKIEESKAEAGVKIENARAEAAREIGKVQVEVASQRERAAKAERALEEIRWRQEPRQLDFLKFGAALKDKPTGGAVVMYQPEDPEAYSLASELSRSLRIAGWVVSGPIPIPPDAATAALKNPSGINRELPPVVRVGGNASSGVTVVANKLTGLVGPPPEKMTPLRALWDAIAQSMGRLGGGVDESLPDNFFRIVVGPKP